MTLLFDKLYPLKSPVKYSQVCFKKVHFEKTDAVVSDSNCKAGKSGGK